MDVRILPPELLQLVVRALPTRADVLVLRRVCRGFCSAATPRAFETIAVDGTEQSAQGLLELAASPVRVFVKEIHFVDNVLDPGGAPRSNRDLIRGLSRLHAFSCLLRVYLSFNPLFDEDEWISCYDDEDGRPADLPLQLRILHALATKPRPPMLQSMHLSNLVAFDHTNTYRSPCMQHLLTHLHTLSLHVRSSLTGSGTFVEDRVCDFWDSALPALLTPPTATLTSLTLHNDVYVAPPLQELHFPRLAALSLRRTLGAESFALAHARTLRALALADCPLFVPVSGATRVWADVWAGFECALGALVCLAVSWTPNAEHEVEEYVGLDLKEGWGYVAESEPLPDKRRDAMAFERLRRTVEMRARGGALL